MGDPENAKRFAKHNLPGEILEILDLDTLHPEKDTFIYSSTMERKPGIYQPAFRSCSTTLGPFPQRFKR